MFPFSCLVLRRGVSKFDRSWLYHDSINEVVSATWRADAATNPMLKMRATRAAPGTWSCKLNDCERELKYDLLKKSLSP